MTRFLLHLRRAEALAAATFLVAMVLLIFAGGIARLMHHPLNWTTDVATCLFAWACFLCADIAWRNDSLMSIDLVTRALPTRLRAACATFNYVVIVAFLVYVAAMGGWLSWISRARSFQGMPGVSYSWVTLSMPVGAVLLLITTWQKVRASRGAAVAPARTEETPC
ncbi:TRAP transporter small permease [Bordetella genomosp. 9]|uniref:TRAP transporter small permease protein n=1 Tax=Bordetella genomosp. 9 TaxID=1416803 RepID=A0A1W6YWS1_9BORD|nr:TRAP transporter small permease subunit [Bordetella genomosp. 9]ARP85441.1 C4-dicarboxylate ABC transporter [Bordetella genomosp. 9]